VRGWGVALPTNQTAHNAPMRDNAGVMTCAPQLNKEKTVLPLKADHVRWASE